LLQYKTFHVFQTLTGKTAEETFKTKTTF